MEEKRLFLTLEQALDVLPKSKTIHCCLFTADTVIEILDTILKKFGEEDE